MCFEVNTCNFKIGMVVCFFFFFYFVQKFLYVNDGKIMCPNRGIPLKSFKRIKVGGKKIRHDPVI